MKTPQQSGRKTFSYTPNIIIKFIDAVDFPYQDELENYLLETGIEDWQHLIDRFPDISISRLFTSVPPDEIPNLVEKAKEIDPSYQPPNFLSYFLIDLPPQIDANALIDALEKWYTVEFAYLEERPSLPAPCADPTRPNFNPRFNNQGYLKKAPQGIDAEYAWKFTNGCGNGINFIDVEYGWKLDHEDLKNANIQLIQGINSKLEDYQPHGTQVLGVVVGTDNEKGGIGVAHAAKTRVISAIDGIKSFNHVNAIMKAVDSLSFGDILLLELQTLSEHKPIEVEKGVFDVVRLGTALGICVIEAAGNGKKDKKEAGIFLDVHTDSAGKQVLNRGSKNFQDSGAIVVGSSTSTVPHTRTFTTNFGTRVDCYAWGENVDTCDSDPSGTKSKYTSTFDGTSSASAIIAGAALIVQGIAEMKLKRRFSPYQLRTILSDEKLGTPAQNDPKSNIGEPGIGVMPNLKAIIAKILNVPADVYIRDFVGDKGDPHSGAINASPDIILLPNKVNNHEKSFGEGSGKENNNALGHKAVTKQDNYIYVRVRNRGGTEAKNVEIKLYHSPVSTLLLLDRWKPIDKSKPNDPDIIIPSVPAGDILTVSAPITWKAQDIPDPGHYCFVGLVGNELDPAPIATDFEKWDNYYRFIKDNNNVTWRNFLVEDKATEQPVPPSPLPIKDYNDLTFLVAGAPDVSRLFQIKVVSRLPEGSEVWIAGSDYFLGLLQQNHFFSNPLYGLNTIYLPINAMGETVIGEAYLTPSSTHEMTLYVYIPEEWRAKYSYEIYVSQLYKDPEIQDAAFEEIGRVTWRLVSE